MSPFRSKINAFLPSIAVIVAIIGLMPLAVEIRDHAIKASAHKPHEPIEGRHVWASSENGKARVVSDWLNSIVILSDSDEELLALDLSKHNIDSHYRAFVRSHVDRVDAHYEMWDSAMRSWVRDEDGEGRTLRIVHSSSIVLRWVLAILTLIGFVGILWRWPAWFQRSLPGWAIAIAGLFALQFVPNMWHAHPITAATLDSDSSRVAFAWYENNDVTFFVWDVATGHGVAKYTISMAAFDKLLLSPDSKALIVSNNGNEIAKWELPQH